MPRYTEGIYVKGSKTTTTYDTDLKGQIEIVPEIPPVKVESPGRYVSYGSEALLQDQSVIDKVNNNPTEVIKNLLEGKSEGFSFYNAKNSLEDEDKAALNALKNIAGAFNYNIKEMMQALDKDEKDARINSKDREILEPVYRDQMRQDLS